MPCTTTTIQHTCSTAAANLIGFEPITTEIRITWHTPANSSCPRSAQNQLRRNQQAPSKKTRALRAVVTLCCSLNGPNYLREMNSRAGTMLAITKNHDKGRKIRRLGGVALVIVRVHWTFFRFGTYGLIESVAVNKQNAIAARTNATPASSDFVSRGIDTPPPGRKYWLGRGAAAATLNHGRPSIWILGKTRDFVRSLRRGADHWRNTPHQRRGRWRI